MSSTPIKAAWAGAIAGSASVTVSAIGGPWWWRSIFAAIACGGYAYMARLLIRASIGDKFRDETRRLQNDLAHATTQEKLDELAQKVQRDFDEFAKESSLPVRLALAGAHARMFVMERSIAASPPFVDPANVAAVESIHRQTVVLFKMFLGPRIQELLQEVSQTGNTAAIRTARDTA